MAEIVTLAKDALRDRGRADAAAMAARAPAAGAASGPAAAPPAAAAPDAGTDPAPRGKTAMHSRAPLPGCA